MPRILNRGWAFYERSISAILPPADRLRYHTHRGHYYAPMASKPSPLDDEPSFQPNRNIPSPLAWMVTTSSYSSPVASSWLMTPDWDIHASLIFKRHAPVYIFLMMTVP